jgi:hypothetical protein
MAMFILFFGTRPGKSREQLLEGVPCGYCGRKNTLLATVTPYYFHLFWLPVFVVHSARIAECAHCKRTYSGEEFTQEMADAFQKDVNG